MIHLVVDILNASLTGVKDKEGFELKKIKSQTKVQASMDWYQVTVCVSLMRAISNWHTKKRRAFCTLQCGPKNQRVALKSPKKYKIVYFEWGCKILLFFTICTFFLQSRAVKMGDPWKIAPICRMEIVLLGKAAYPTPPIPFVTNKNQKNCSPSPPGS